MTDRPTSSRRTAKIVSAGVLGLAGTGAAGAIAYAAGQNPPASKTTSTPAIVQPQTSDQQAVPQQDPGAGSYYTAPDEGTGDSGLSSGAGAAPSASTGAS